MVEIPQAPLRIRTARVAATPKRPARVRVYVNDNGVRTEHTVLPGKGFNPYAQMSAARQVATKILGEPARVTEVEATADGIRFEAVPRG